MQSLCSVRRLHPNVHHWPKRGWGDDKRIKKYDTGSGQINWKADSADKVANIFKEAILSLVNNKKFWIKKKHTHRLRAFTSCNSLVLGFDEQPYPVSFSAKEVRRGDYGSYFETADIVLIASGFGVERNSHFAGPLSWYVGNSYWRNDPIGQSNLLENNETYLVSGGGDGALVDVFRLLIEDYYQDSSLRSLLPTELKKKSLLSDYDKHVKSKSKKKRSTFVDRYYEYLKIIREAEKEPAGLFFKLEEFFKNNSDVYSVVAQRFEGKIRANVKCILHLITEGSLNKIQRVVDNGEVTLYNRILFYYMYAVADIEIVMTPSWNDHSNAEQRRSLQEQDIAQIVKEYNISKGNIVVRHGVDVFRPIVTLLRDSGHADDELCSFNESYDGSIETSYRLGTKLS